MYDEMSQILIKKGHYRGQEIVNATFLMARPWSLGAKGGFVTVINETNPDYQKGKFRVRCEREDAVMLQDGIDLALDSKETDEQILKRLENRFSNLGQMTEAAAEGVIKGLVVCGAPGTGKSHSVEQILGRASLINLLGDTRPMYEVFKGYMSPINLYKSLFTNAQSRFVTVFDDCDSVLFDELSINLLKAALDTTRKRWIHWNSESHYLDATPRKFEFNGTVIFITNMNFERIVEQGRSKIAPHLDAIISRCHVLDLTLDTLRDKFLRVQQVVRGCNMLVDQGLSNTESEEVLDFMKAHVNKFREMSLRMAIKIADLRRVDTKNWQELAMTTCFRKEYANK